MNILLVNDDGFDAKGLKILAHALSQFGKVYVSAPKKHQSAMANAISISDRITLEEIKPINYVNKMIVVDGTPSDCTRLGIKYFDVDFDLVVSGLNDGNNIASNTIYSGTVAAAMEGKLLGVHSIAMSASTVDLDYLYDECVKIIDEVLESKIYEGNYILNINFPDRLIKKPLGVKITTQGKKYLHAEYIESEKKNEYFVKYSEILYLEDENSDVLAYEQGYVSITPITLDKTDVDAYNKLKEKF